jgi:hypothetical protein
MNQIPSLFSLRFFKPPHINKYFDLVQENSFQEIPIYIAQAIFVPKGQLTLFQEDSPAKASLPAKGRLNSCKWALNLAHGMG